MTSHQLDQFREIRRLLREAYDDYFARDDEGAHNSSEGYVEVYYPNYFEATESDIEASGVGVYSYVLGPARMHHFGSFAEALTVVRKWHAAQLAWTPEA